MDDFAILRQVIPDDLQAEIMQRGEQASSDRWWLGDICNKIKRSIEGKVDVRVAALYEFVSYLYGEDPSARSIEYYAMLSGFYSEAERSKYDVLCHAHFAQAHTKSKRGLDRVEPFVWLQTAMDLFEAYGQRPSVRRVEAAFCGLRTLQPCPGDVPQAGGLIIPAECITIPVIQESNSVFVVRHVLGVLNSSMAALREQLYPREQELLDLFVLCLKKRLTNTKNLVR